MPANIQFLHGVEVIESNVGPVPIQVVTSAVVGVVGSAPLFAVPGATPLWDPSWLVQAAPQWMPSTLEAAGNLIVDSNGNTQKCTTPGTTGSSAPARWQRTFNATTLDGSVVWTLIALGSSTAGQQCIDSHGNLQTATAVTAPNWAGSFAYAIGNLVIDSNGNTQRCTTAGTSNNSAPTWSTTSGGTTADGGSVVWTLVAIGRAAITGTTPPTWTTTLNNTTTDTIGTPTGSVTWTLTALGPITNLQAPVLIAGATPDSLAPGQAATFGPRIQGFTIPYALNQIFSQGAGQAIVVNVFDQTKHSTVISSVDYSFPTSGIQAFAIGTMGISGIKITNTGNTITYVEGADFNVDRVNGIITAIGGGRLTTGQAVKVTYAYADPSRIIDTDLVGTVTGTTYTGMQCWKLAFGLLGFFPMLLIAPSDNSISPIAQSVGSQDASVAAGMATIAAAIRAMYFVDCPSSTSASTMLANRGNAGNSWNTSDKRAVLCGPCEIFLDSGIVPNANTINPITGMAVQTIANATHSGPYSPWVAGATAARDLAQGYWRSPSNTQIIGALGPDIAIYSSYIDSASDTNTLNSQGVLTAFTAFGTGIRTWGNRSAAFPIFSTPDVFIPVRRTMDVIERSIMLTMLQFLDQPISNALITSILASVNAFLRTLIGRGALIAGNCTFDPAENPPNQIAAGQLVFDIDCIPPPPAERLTFNVFIDSTLLNQLTGSVQASGATTPVGS